MARIKATLGVEYTDDFGNESPTPIPFKIHADAPIPDDFYVPREQVVCTGGGTGFKMRKLKATFAKTDSFPDVPNGTFEYPVPTRRDSTGIVALGQALFQLGAICIDLDGEKWIRIGKGVIGSTKNFKVTPYTDIPGEPEKTGYNYTYDSDVAEVGTNLAFSVSVETLPESLKNAQISCLANAVEKVAGSKSICAGGSQGITPRYFILQALSRSPEAVSGNLPPDGTVIRKVNVSAFPANDHKTCGDGLVELAYCLGYKGESIRNLHELVNLNT